MSSETALIKTCKFYQSLNVALTRLEIIDTLMVQLFQIQTSPIITEYLCLASLLQYLEVLSLVF